MTYDHYRRQNNSNHNEENSTDYEDESKLEKIEHILQTIVFSKWGIKIISFLSTWMIAGMIGVCVLIIPLAILDNWVPSIEMDIKKNEYIVIDAIASFWFTFIYMVLVSTNNSWLLRRLNEIPNLSKRVETVETTLTVEQKMQKAQDNETLLLFAKFITATVKQENPKLYTKIMKEIEETKTANELSIKRVGTETYRAIPELRKEFKKSHSKNEMSFRQHYLEDDE